MSNHSTRGYDSMMDAAMDMEYERRESESERDEVIESIADQLLQSGLIKEASIYCAAQTMNYDAEIVLAAQTMCDAGIIEVYQDDEKVPLIARAKRILSLARDMIRHDAPTEILFDDDENYLPQSEPIFASQLAERIFSYSEKNCW